MNLLLLAVLAASDGGVPAQPKVAMHGAFQSLTTLVWLTAKPPRAEQVPDLDRELAVLEALPHAFDGTKAKREPGLATIGALLSGYTRQTRARLAARELNTAGQRVRTIASLCLACHTREPVAVDFRDGERRFEQLELTPLERARVLAATRQFELALESYARITKGSVNQADAFPALEESLAVLIRAKNDPKAASALIRDALERRQDDATQATSVRVLTEWKKDVEAWLAEPKDLLSAGLPDGLERSRALIATQRDVPLLRSTAALTSLLARHPTSPLRGELLWELGVATGAQNSALLWDLDLFYLEACVRENPKTPLARRCFQRFQERLTLGFSGSGGTHIPQDEATRLEALQQLSTTP